MTHAEFVAWMNGFLNGRCPWKYGPNGEIVKKPQEAAGGNQSPSLV